MSGEQLGKEERSEFTNPVEGADSSLDPQKNVELAEEMAHASDWAETQAAKARQKLSELQPQEPSLETDKEIRRAARGELFFQQEADAETKAVEKDYDKRQAS